MPEENKIIKWAPKIPSFSSGRKEKASGNERFPGWTWHADPENKGRGFWKRSSKDCELVDGLFYPPRDPKKLNELKRKQMKDTAGKAWFDMPAPTITPELKKDLQILKLRSVIDPKRHYKKADSKTLPKYFQVGTVIESASDFFSSRLTKKERKSTLAEELLSDRTLGDYRKRKVREIGEQHRSSTGVAKWKIKGKHARKRAK